MEVINNKKDKRRAKTPSNRNKLNLKYEKISEYIKLNKFSFQNLENRNFAFAKFNFEKCIELAEEIDQFKYIESLINYSIALYCNNEIANSLINLNTAKDLSYNIYEKSEEINQIYFIYLRALCNMCLISINMNKFEESKNLFHKCISLIKEPKIKNIKIQISMLRELIYIFYRIDSINKFHDINESSLYSINYKIHLKEKGLYYLYESFRNNNMKLWISYLNKELQNNNQDNAEYIWILINRIIALYYIKGEKTNFENDINNLMKYIEENFNDENNINNNDINYIISNAKNKFELAIEYYREIANLENELQMNLGATNIKNKKGKENKIMIKLLLKNAIKNLQEKEDTDKKLKEIKKQIECALYLIEKNQINWELLSILNINKELIKSIKNLFHNLLRIKYLSLLRHYFNKYKEKTLGYSSLKNKIKKKYKKSEEYLKKQLLCLEEGSILTKFNYNSKGSNNRFYRISLIDDIYYLCVHKKISEIKPYKVYNLEELYDITIGISTDNLQNKIDKDFFQEYKPWNILSLWFEERTIDLYFDDEEEINMWFEGIYYYNKYISKKSEFRSLNYFFFNKARLKMLYNLKNIEVDLPIIEQLKYYSSQNELEYQLLPFTKTIILYFKIKKKING